MLYNFILLLKLHVFFLFILSVFPLFEGALSGMLIRSWEVVMQEGKGIEYVSVSLMDMRHKLFIPSLENEQCLVELVKKVSFACQVHHNH